MVRLFSSCFAVIFACACIALGCGGGRSAEAPHGGMGSSSAGTSASSGGAGTADGAGSSGTGGSADSGGAGGAAVVTDLFVDALVGADTNPGTQEKRFKTLTHALSVATGGQTVRLYPGTYDASNGETFPEVVPDGVTIDAVVAGDAVVLGAGIDGGQVGMYFAGSGTLRNLRLQGFFASAVKAEAGEVALHATELRQDGTAIFLSGSAQAVCEGCVVANGGSAFELRDDALLTMKGGEIHDLGPSCSGGFGHTSGASMVVLEGVNAHDIGSSFELRDTSDVTIKSSVIKNTGAGMCGGGAFVGDTFDVVGSSSLRLEDTTISGGPGWAIMIESGAKLVVTNASISTPDGINVSGDADVTIDGTTFDGSTFSEAASTCVYVGSPGAKVALTDTKIDAFETGVQVYRGVTQLRNTTIGHATTGVLFQGGSLDLGSVSEPGGNIWQTNTGTALRVSPSAGAVVPAFGNTWIPDTQGADANGHYSFGVIAGPYGLTAPVPCNFAIADGSKVVR